jgi:hypothetical protein
MRRLIAALGMLALAVAAQSGCKRQKTVRENAAEDDTAQLVSVVNAADPRATVQLLHGFYGVESNAWRWTMSKFSVSLRPPGGAAQAGARLELKLVIPDVINKRLGPVKVSANVNGTALPPETYPMAGSFTYTRDVPASALAGDAVTVDFATDKSIPPGAQDVRELALIFTSAGLVPAAAK